MVCLLLQKESSSSSAKANHFGMLQLMHSTKRTSRIFQDQLAARPTSHTTFKKITPHAKKLLPAFMLRPHHLHLRGAPWPACHIGVREKAKLAIATRRLW